MDRYSVVNENPATARSQLNPRSLAPNSTQVISNTDRKSLNRMKFINRHRVRAIFFTVFTGDNLVQKVFDTVFHPGTSQELDFDTSMMYMVKMQSGSMGKQML